MVQPKQKKSKMSKNLFWNKVWSQKIGTEAKIAGITTYRGVSRNRAKVAILAKQLRKQTNGLGK